MASAVELVRRLKQRPTSSEAPKGGGRALRPVAGAFLAWPVVAARSWLNNNLGSAQALDRVRLHRCMGLVARNGQA